MLFRRAPSVSRLCHGCNLAVLVRKATHGSHTLLELGPRGTVGLPDVIDVETDDVDDVGAGEVLDGFVVEREVRRPREQGEIGIRAYPYVADSEAKELLVGLRSSHGFGTPPEPFAVHLVERPQHYWPAERANLVDDAVQPLREA